MKKIQPIVPIGEKRQKERALFADKAHNVNDTFGKILDSYIIAYKESVCK